MTDVFSRISEDAEDADDGLASELRDAAAQKRADMVDKMVQGRCKTWDSYTEAVGMVRGLDFILTYAERKREEARKRAADEDKQEN